MRLQGNAIRFLALCTTLGLISERAGDRKSSRIPAKSTKDDPKRPLELRTKNENSYS
jgi:hypothetical protein